MNRFDMTRIISPKVIALVGPPGSGKGTQARLLVERLKYNVIHVSQIIKDKFETQPDNLNVIQAKKNYTSGGLVDGKVIAQWISEKIHGLGEKIVLNGLIIDGGGRTIQEARATISVLTQYISKNDIRVFFLVISPKETIRRNTQRIVCINCLRPIPPDLVGKIDKCPYCGGKLGKRSMDEQNIIENRLRVYKKLTLPTIDYLKKEGMVIDIDGEQGIEDVYNDIIEHIKIN